MFRVTDANAHAWAEVWLRRARLDALRADARPATEPGATDAGIGLPAQAARPVRTTPDRPPTTAAPNTDDPDRPRPDPGTRPRASSVSVDVGRPDSRRRSEPHAVDRRRASLVVGLALPRRPRRAQRWRRSRRRRRRRNAPRPRRRRRAPGRRRSTGSPSTGCPAVAVRHAAGGRRGRRDAAGRRTEPSRCSAASPTRRRSPSGPPTSPSPTTSSGPGPTSRRSSGRSARPRRGRRGAPRPVSRAARPGGRGPRQRVTLRRRADGLTGAVTPTVDRTRGARRRTPSTSAPHVAHERVDLDEQDELPAPEHVEDLTVVAAGPDPVAVGERAGGRRCPRPRPVR